MGLTVTVQGIGFEIAPTLAPDVRVTHAADGTVESYTERWTITGWLKGPTSAIAAKWQQLKAVAATAPVTVVFVGTGLALSPVGSAPGTPRIVSLTASGDSNWTSLVKFEMQVEVVVPVGAVPPGTEGGGAQGPPEAQGLNVTDAVVRSEFEITPDGRTRHSVFADARGRDAKEFVGRALRERVNPENVTEVRTETTQEVGPNGTPTPGRAHAEATEEPPEEEVEETEARDPAGLSPSAIAPAGFPVEVFRLLETRSVSGGVAPVRAHPRASGPPLVTSGPAEPARLVVSGRASATPEFAHRLAAIKEAFPPQGIGTLSGDPEFRDLGPTDFNDRDKPQRFGVEYTATFLVAASLAAALPAATHRFEQQFRAPKKSKAPALGFGMFGAP